MEERRNDAGKSRRRRRRRYQIRIDGELFEASSPEEIEYLVAQARAAAEEKAAAEAQTVIKKRRTASRRDGKPLRLDPVYLDIPDVSPVDTESADVARRIQAQLNEIYAKAAHDAELALHMYYARVIDEEEAISVLLLS